MLYVGIDPGNDTGMAVADEQGNILEAAIVKTRKCLNLPAYSSQWILEATEGKEFKAAIEGQHFGAGVSKMTVLATCRNAAIHEAACYLCGAEDVWRPFAVEWRKLYGIATYKRIRAKDFAIDFCNKQLSYKTDNDNIAEACLIAKGMQFKEEELPRYEKGRARIICPTYLPAVRHSHFKIS